MRISIMILCTHSQKIQQLKELLWPNLNSQMLKQSLCLTHFRSIQSIWSIRKSEFWEIEERDLLIRLLLIIDKLISLIKTNLSLFDVNWKTRITRIKNLNCSWIKRTQKYKLYNRTFLLWEQDLNEKNSNWVFELEMKKQKLNLWNRVIKNCRLK